MKVLKYRFVCQYCEHSFTRENDYLNHNCDQKKRDAEVRTPLGQAAFQLFQDWNRSHKRSPPALESFLHSRYYRTFIKVAQYVKDVQIPDINLFMWFMKEKDYGPMMWMSDQVYVNFIEFLDRKTDPMYQVDISVKTLLELAEKYQTDISNIFKVIHPGEVITLLRVRKLSPWLLMFSQEYKDLYLKRTTADQRIHINALIRTDYWLKKFEKHPKEKELIREIIKEMHL